MQMKKFLIGEPDTYSETHERQSKYFLIWRIGKMKTSGSVNQNVASTLPVTGNRGG